MPMRPLSPLSVLAALGHLSQGERQGVLGSSKKPRGALAISSNEGPAKRVPFELVKGLAAFLPVQPLSSLSVLAALGHLSQRERQGVLGSSKKPRGGLRSLQMRAQRSGSHLSLSRVLQPFCRCGHCLPSPSSLRSATSPKGRGKGCSAHQESLAAHSRSLKREPSGAGLI